MARYRSTYKQLDGSPFPPQFVHPVIKNGVLHTYFRRAGDPSAAIKGAALLRTGVVALTAGWWDQYWALKQRRPLAGTGGAGGERVVEPGQVVPGSWDALMAHYTAHSEHWRGLKKRTQDGYAKYHRKISRVIGRFKVADTSAAQLKALIRKKQFGDAANGIKAAPIAARDLRQTLACLCEHARKELKWIEVNPIYDIDKPKSKNKKGYHTLTEAQIAAYREAWPDPRSDARRVLEMVLAWGPRAGDLLQLGWKDIEDGWIKFTPMKTEESTGAEVILPVETRRADAEHLLAVLEHCPKDQRFFFQKPPRGFNQYTNGKLVELKPEPWSYIRLQKSWVEWRAQAGLSDECKIHGLRKAFATRMANEGANPQDIADALGDTMASALIYTKARDRRQGSARAVNTRSDAA